MSVESQVQAQVDHIGLIKQAFETAISARNPDALWLAVDAASNIAYENRVRGSLITEVDNAISNISIGQIFQNWFRLHNDYYAMDAGLETPTGDLISTFKAAIEGNYRWRVSQEFNDVMKSTLGSGSGISNAYVFPSSLISLGTYTATGTSTGTFTDGDAADTTLSGPGIVGLKVINQSIQSNNVVTAITLKYEDLTTVSVAATAASSAAAGTVYNVGEKSLTSNHTAASDAGVISISATSPFKVGQKVLVKDSESQEVAEVVSISTNASLTLKKIDGDSEDPSLRNDYTTANSAKVIPLYIDVTAMTNSNGTSGDDLELVFIPDRSATL
jgi:hypothetical protein